MDFFGTPKVVIKKANVFHYMHDKPVKLSYHFDQRMMLVKPLGLSLTIFSFYLLAILSSRLNLSFSKTANKEE